MSRAWPLGAATGLGSLPGEDPVEAAALVFGELPELPHLPELPARGPGAQMIGRTAALLVDLPVELVPSGWRLTAHDGRDVRRSRDFLARDLDAIQTHGGGYCGAFKVQVVGPMTLAAMLELPNGHSALSDPGAVREITASLTEAVLAHLVDVRARLAEAQVVLQLDEPQLPAVLAGRIATPSGYGTIRAVEAEVAVQHLRAALAAAEPGHRVIHCCAAQVPWRLLCEAGADAIAMDVSRLDSSQYDDVGEALDAGTGLWLGVVPSSDDVAAPAVTFDVARSELLRVWRELGFAASQLAESVVPTPACGLAGASPQYVRRALSVLRDLGKDLRDRA